MYICECTESSAACGMLPLTLLQRRWRWLLMRWWRQRPLLLLPLPLLLLLLLLLRLPPLWLLLPLPPLLLLLLPPWVLLPWVLLPLAAVAGAGCYCVLPTRRLRLLRMGLLALHSSSGWLSHHHPSGAYQRLPFPGTPSLHASTCA
jgi:hypothetical protein